jgi:ABC-type transport system involved in cytochrome c biogenesis permease subunit
LTLWYTAAQLRPALDVRDDVMRRPIVVGLAFVTITAILGAFWGTETYGVS